MGSHKHHGVLTAFGVEPLGHYRTLPGTKRIPRFRDFFSVFESLVFIVVVVGIVTWRKTVFLMFFVLQDRL